jgi:heme-degrading monooxygenase HmoA
MEQAFATRRMIELMPVELEAAVATSLSFQRRHDSKHAARSRSTRCGESAPFMMICSSSREVSVRGSRQVDEIMVLRLWATGLDAARATEYDAFANSRSLAMFKALEGCLGVIFVRSDVRGYVLSFWRDMASIEALEYSELYRSTVRDILAVGFLEEPQTTELVNLTGGFLSEETSVNLFRLLASDFERSGVGRRQC